MHLIVLVLMHIQQPDSKHRYPKDVEHGECDGFVIGVDAPRALAECEQDDAHGPQDDSVDGELGVEPGRLGMLVLRAWRARCQFNASKRGRATADVDT